MDNRLEDETDIKRFVKEEVDAACSVIPGERLHSRLKRKLEENIPETSHMFVRPGVMIPLCTLLLFVAFGLTRLGVFTGSSSSRDSIRVIERFLVGLPGLNTLDEWNRLHRVFPSPAYDRGTVIWKAVDKIHKILEKTERSGIKPVKIKNRENIPIFTDLYDEIYRLHRDQTIFRFLEFYMNMKKEKNNG